MRSLALAFSLFAALSVLSQPARPEVLVLGTYHMASPGRDIFNSRVDDVLAPKRQAEIAEVVAVLKRFQPTKIAVERNAGDQRIKKDYAAYLAGTHELTRNEIEELSRQVQELNADVRNLMADSGRAGSGRKASAASGGRKRKAKAASRAKKPGAKAGAKGATRASRARQA